MIELFLQFVSSGLFGWLPRLRMADPTRADVVFWFGFGRMLGISTKSGESYWVIPWLTLIKSYTIASNPEDYEAVRITSLDGHSWSISVAVTWRLRIPEHAATRMTTDEEYIQLAIITDSVVLGIFKQRTDEQIISLASSQDVESDMKDLLTERSRWYGYEAESVSLQGFYRVRCLNLDGI